MKLGHEIRQTVHISAHLLTRWTKTDYLDSRVCITTKKDNNDIYLQMDISITLDNAYRTSSKYHWGFSRATNVLYS